ncbi:MAG: phosphatase PAP2 family protein [Nitrospiria bacterium]
MTTRSALRDLSLTCLVLMALSGCGTLPNGRAWGEDATLWPGLPKIRGAALHAIQSPVTWIPVAGTVVFSLGHLDQRVSDWASEKTPVFGSVDAADKASNSLLYTTIGGALLTALAAPSGPDSASKLKGLGVELAAGSATAGLTGLLHVGINRERPNGLSGYSFPSGHSSGVFAAAALGGENVESLPLSDGVKTGVRTGFVTLAAGTAWARVEAKEHFPSDVLAGAALGNFISIFIHDAFLGLDENAPVALSVEPQRNGWVLAIHAKFY